MDRLKQLRRPIRGLMTRTINECTTALDQDDVDVALLRANLQFMSDTMVRLEELDQKVIDQMIDDLTLDDDQYQDAEYDSIAGYKKAYLTMKTKIEERLHPPRSPTNSEFGTASTTSNTKRRSYKLPKIELRKFDGELKNWLGWWAQFAKIDDDENLHDSDKFQYLSQSMEPNSVAKELVDGYPQTAENYPVVIEALKEKFGRHDLLLQVYVRELLTLVISNVASKDKIPLAKLHLQLESHLRSLASMSLTNADPATWLFPLVESSLSEDTLRAWQRSNLSKEDGSKRTPPKSRLDLLMEFIRVEVQAEQQISLARSGFQQQSPVDPKKKSNAIKIHKNQDEDFPTAAGLFTAQKQACAFCDNPHDSDRCVKALSMTLEDRNIKVKEKYDVCFKCLKPGHRSKRCKAVVKCAICGGKHYPVLCSGKSYPPPKEQETEPSHSNTDVVIPSASAPQFGSFPGSASHTNQCSGDVLLNTILIKLHDGGKWKIVRLVGDSGSQRSYVRRSALVGIKCEQIGSECLQNVLFGGGSTAPQRYAKYRLFLSAANGKSSSSFDLLERETICGKIPRVPNGPWVEELHRKNIELTDQGQGCSDIDILLGNDYWGRILTGQIVKLDCGLVATETIFGWTLGGRVPATNMATTVTSMMTCSRVISDLWSLEALGIKDSISIQTQDEVDKQAEEVFASSVSRDDEGRYIVALPWRDEELRPPTNRHMAEKRLQNTTYNLKKENKFEVYDNVFRAWEKEGMISAANLTETGHYLPHRPVFKESLTTPVRPVFVASSKTGNHPSLNDCLHKGPNLLEVLPALLLRFGEKPVGVTADVRKAFQMLKVREEDQEFQKFLWWEDSQCRKLIEYKHNRVVFGINSSPYLLGATIKLHLESMQPPYQDVARKMLHSFYVDNLVTSLNDHEEYFKFQQQATMVMKLAKMDLREWACTKTENEDSKQENYLVSILGLKWDRGRDLLSCNVKPFDQSEKVTKRVILSTISQIFDPLGFASPSVLTPKRLFQNAWCEKLGWDDTLPENVSDEFKSWLKDVQFIGSVQIPRFYQLKDATSSEVHVFCDASQYAYAAAVFLRSEKDGEVKVQLLIAKSRLAPIKKCTIPRLELMSCVIAVRLANVVKTSVPSLAVAPFRYWSDSSTTLAWIRRNGDWGVFVRNRVKEILQHSNSMQWNHVPGLQNPADFPSRGCLPKQLVESRWWEGPLWLYKNTNDWPAAPEEPDENIIMAEMKKVSVQQCNLAPLLPVDMKPSPFSSYRKNVAVWGCALRFVNLCLKRTSVRRKYLAIDELRQAAKIVLRKIQQESFPPNAENIHGVRVLRDKEGLIRVETRISNRKDYHDFLFPVLLPKSHPLVDMLIREFHLLFCHAGIQFVMSKLREKYWIVHSRRAVRKILKECVKCKRFTSSHAEVEPSALPEARVKTSAPFETTGVDLAGPLSLRGGEKAWIVLYTCAVYRCIHLDVVSSLSTEAFLGSLERFVNCFGRPNTIFSDNGTNFVGAVSVFQRLNWTDIERACTVKQIHWIFNPPTASWWGGWWERLVRSVKDLLRRMLGRAKLTFDELRTCLSGVSAVINDRPLTAVTENNEDLIPLTPSMFLRGSSYGVLPETADAQALTLAYRRMKKIQQQLQDRFRREYLSLLVQRPVMKAKTTVKEGDVVLVGADNKKRFEWPLGLVIQLLPGRDGKSRVAKVRTKTGIFLRPLQRLYPLEVSREDEVKVISTGIPELSKTIEIKKTDAAVITKKGRIVKVPRRYWQWLHLIVNYN